MKRLSAEELLETRDLSSFTSASVLGALPEESILWLLERGKILAMDQGEYLFGRRFYSQRPLHQKRVWLHSGLTSDTGDREREHDGENFEHRS